MGEDVAIWRASRTGPGALPTFPGHPVTASPELAAIFPQWTAASPRSRLALARPRRFRAAPSCAESILLRT